MGEAKGDQFSPLPINGGKIEKKLEIGATPLVVNGERVIKPRTTHAQYVQRRNEQIEEVRQDIKKIVITDKDSQPGWIAARRQAYQKILTRERYPSSSIPLRFSRRTTVKKLEQAGVADAENVLRLLEGTLLFSDQYEDKQTIISHLKTLYADLQKGHGIDTLKEIPNITQAIEKLYLFGFGSKYDLNVRSLLTPSDRYREMFRRTAQLDSENFYRNAGQLEQYEFLFDRFNTLINHGNDKKFSESLPFLDILGASQISGELLTAISTADDVRKIGRGAVIEVDDILYTCNPAQLIASARRAENKLFIIASYLADHGLRVEDLKDYKDTNPDAIPYEIYQMDEDALDRLSKLVKSGWRVSQGEECNEDFITRAEITSGNFTDPTKLDRLAFFQDVKPDGMEDSDFYRLGSVALMESAFADETLAAAHALSELTGSTGQEGTDIQIGRLLRFDRARGIGVDVASVNAIVEQLRQSGNLPDTSTAYWNFWLELSAGGLLEYENVTRFLLGSKDYVSSQLQGESPSAELVDALKKRYTEAIRNLRYKEKDQKRNSFITYFLEDHVPPDLIGLSKFIADYSQKRSIDVNEVLYNLSTWKGLCSDEGQPNPALFYEFMKAGNVRYIDSPHILSDELIATFPDQDQNFFKLYTRAPYDLEKLLETHHELFVSDRADTQRRLTLLQEYADVMRRMPSPVQSELISNADLKRTFDPAFDEAEFDEGREVQLRKSLLILGRIYSSPSKEIHRIAAPLLSLLLASDHPEADFASVERIYVGNNLPNAMKEGLVFEQVFSQTDEEGKTLIAKKLAQRDDLVLLSRVLTEADDQTRFRLFRGYIFTNAIRSGDRNLREYLTSFREAQRIIGYIDKYGFDAVPYREEKIRFLNRAEALFGVTYTIGSPDSQIPESDIKGRFNRLAKSLGADSYVDIPKRLKQVFLHPFGYTSIDDVLHAMDAYTAHAARRNATLATSITAGGPIFTEGDLLKSTQSKIIKAVLKTGPKSAEALGAELESNNTPFDADFSRVALDDLALPFDQVLAAALTRTAMSQYNDLLLLVKNRGNFFDTSNSVAGFPSDFSRYETFWSKYADKTYGKAGDQNRRHYGVLVGVAATDVDAIILTDAFVASPNYETNLATLFFQIAHGACPIPVIYKGKLVAHLEELERYKTPVSGINGFIAGQDIIETLKKNPYLKKLYHMSAGVQEQYSLQAHTKMVLDRFDRYWKERFIALNLNAQEFALMLALHDIGKPIASSSQLQHDATRPIIEDILTDVDLPALRKELIVEIASQDMIGQFLQGNQTFEKTIEGIQYIARKTGTTAKEVYWLCKYYFQCDVGSYTKDADPTVERGRFDDDIAFDQTNGTMNIVNPDWIKQLERLDTELLQ